MSERDLDILLIEDDEDDYVFVRDILAEIRSPRHLLHWKATYEEALEAAKSQDYDAYLLDYRLGRRDGIEFLKEMNRQGCNTPIILLTGQGSDNVDQEAMKTGAADYLVKNQISGPLLERSIRHAIERKRSEETLRKSEEKYRRIIETALEGVWIHDEKGETIYVNQRMADMLGYSIEEISLGHSSLFMDDTTRAQARGHFYRTREGIGAQFDFHLRRKDGSDLYALVSASPILDDRSRFLGSLYMITDISERKKAEDALKASEEQMRLIIEDAPLGIIICQHDRCVYVNPTFLQMFGYRTQEEILGVPQEALFFSCDASAQAWRQDHEKWKPSTSHEATGLRKNGERFDLAVRSTRIEYRGIPAIMNFVMDISVEKALRTRLLHAQKAQAIGTLAGGIAHDFNNILGIILGMTELAIRDIPVESRAHLNLNHALDATQRGIDLVNQILTFSRRNEQLRQPLHLIPIVKECLRLLRASFPSTIEIRIDLRLSHGQDVILSDPVRIHQVLMNLCVNSAHAMREKGGILEVGLSAIRFEAGDPELPVDLVPGDYVKLSVIDTGHGIDRAIMHRIFDPYFTTKAVGEGSGLGLGIVQGIVKNHDGAITVTSEPHRGTSFHVYLPQRPGGFEMGQPSCPLGPTGNERILFVDDEEWLVDAGVQILERLGYRVVATTSSREALATFRSEPDKFDLVITDHTMPHMTGTELAREILRTRPGTAIILCTGFSELVSAETAAQIGIGEFVLKPFVMQDMAVTVRRVLDSVRKTGGRDVERSCP